MIVESMKQASNLVQNVHVHLTNAVTDASLGGDYSENWEKAMQCQTELLREINNLKYKRSQKPRSIPGEQAQGNLEC